MLISFIFEKQIIFKSTIHNIIVSSASLLALRMLKSSYETGIRLKFFYKPENDTRSLSNHIPTRNPEKVLEQKFSKVFFKYQIEQTTSKKRLKLCIIF